MKLNDLLNQVKNLTNYQFNNANYFLKVFTKRNNNYNNTFDNNEILEFIRNKFIGS